jgi:hypothetical protein
MFSRHDTVPRKDPVGLQRNNNLRSKGGVPLGSIARGQIENVRLYPGYQVTKGKGRLKVLL